jgi:CRISPR locus-related DNA-binding protein
MRKRLHIATLGLHRNILVEHVIAKRGADKIAIIHTDKNMEDMEKIRQENETIGVPVITKKVNAWDFYSSLCMILEVVSDHEEYEIEYSISCGTRVMTSAAFRAALFTDSPVFFVTTPDDIEIGDLITIEPISVVILTEPKRRILERLDELGGDIKSQSDLGSRTSLKASSISKHLTSLENAGYVRRKREGRRTYVAITELGKIVLNLKRFRRTKLWGE